MLVPRTLIFLTRGKRVLLLKGSAHKTLWADRYNGIGGHIEPGEDALSSARRELLEETGLVSTDLRICGVITIDTGRDVGVGIFVFTGECTTGEPRPSAEGELEWVQVSQIDLLPLVEDLPRLLPHVLFRKPTDPPFSAQYTYNPQGDLEITFASQ